VITRHIVDALLNERERRPLSRTVPALTENGLVEQTLRFHYCSKGDGGRSCMSFARRPEASTFTPVARTRIEDAQAAEEAVLRYQNRPRSHRGRGRERA